MDSGTSFPGFLYKPEICPSLNRTSSWDTQALGAGHLGPFGTHYPLFTYILGKAFKSVSANKMGRHLDGCAWQACVSLPRVCPSASLGDKRGVQLPLLVNKSLEHMVGRVASSHEVEDYVEGGQTFPICFSDLPER